ncbi:MAG: BatA domain-containing protein [Planctomycetes bacterium]|nr:BatA domain-containing protein [Planctomycetota bacterium]
MSWFSPLYLWGLATLAIPILIHLIFQKRYKRVKWAAMEFLLVAMQKTRSRLKLENILLLLIRMAILLLLALAFSRPFLSRFGGIFEGASQRSVHLTLVIDRSYSMEHVEGNVSARTRALQEARARIDGLDPEKGDTLTLVTLEDTPQIWAGIKFSSDMKAALASLDSLDGSDAGTDVPALASRLLELAEEDRSGPGGLPAHPEKSLVLLTDLAAVGWGKGGGEDSPFHGRLREIAREYGPIEIVDVGPAEKEPANLVVEDLTTAGKVICAGMPATFLATLKNHSAKEAAGIEVDFLVDGKRTSSERDITTPPREARTVLFQHTFSEAGPHTAEVSIVAGGAGGAADRLQTDNRRTVVFTVKERLPVLLLNGDPTDDPFDSATFYLERVLAPGPTERKISILVPDVVTELPAAAALAAYEVVFLANVRAVEGEGASSLLEYVGKGGSAILFLGDLVEPARYNETLYDESEEPFLPGKIGRRFYGGPNLDQTDEYAYFVPADYDHPAFRYFKGNRDLQNLFNQTLTREFYLLEPDSLEGSRTLATYSDGARSPAIVERTFGEGKVILVTTSADRRWTWLPVCPVFVPLMHELVLYAAHRDAGRRNLIVGQPWLGRYPFLTQEKARILRPLPPGAAHGGAAESVDLARPEPEGGGIRVFYGRTDRAGVYRVEFRDVLEADQDVGDYNDLFGVSVDPAEGDLSRLSMKSLEEKYPGVPFRREEENALPAAAQGQELWRPLLWVALALLVIESWVALRFGRFSK